MIAVYLDTNAFISAFESNSERADEMLRVFDAVGSRELRGVTSELSLAELLPKPLQLGQTALSELYTDMLSGDGSIEVVPVSRQILIATARLRSQYGTLKLPDAVHLATAVQAHCRAMLSDDRRLPMPTNLQIVQLGPHSLENIRLIRP